MQPVYWTMQFLLGYCSVLKLSSDKKSTYNNLLQLSAACKHTLWSELSTNDPLVGVWYLRRRQDCFTFYTALISVLWFAYFQVSSISGLKALWWRYLCDWRGLRSSVQLFFGPSRQCWYFWQYLDPIQLNSIPELGVVRPCMPFPWSLVGNVLGFVWESLKFCIKRAFKNISNGRNKKR